ncbi:hypothetical protein AVEN_196042-1 [Araneus ventricosus]|uniref:Uncharacterized protein n=1 Tax=Araneus ventricosus TaxID=182803 RepID=A0A4Y2P0W9_ARAVE|nr:hypothetical protein AVEN_196042-1 [Araneus ventricosus]
MSSAVAVIAETSLKTRYLSNNNGANLNIKKPSIKKISLPNSATDKRMPPFVFPAVATVSNLNLGPNDNENLFDECRVMNNKRASLIKNQELFSRLLYLINVEK